MVRRFIVAIVTVFAATPALGQGLIVFSGPQADDLQRFVTEAAEPTSVTVPAGASLEDALRDHCGHVHAAVQFRAVRRLNPGPRDFSAQPSIKLVEDATIVLPACLYWRPGPVVYKLGEGQTLTMAASSQMGHSGEQTLRGIREATLARFGAMPRIAAGALIALPYVSRPTRLVPAAGYSTNRFMDELVKRSASTALENRVVFTAEARFADSISSDGCVDSGSGYPVALPEVHRVIALNAWHKTKVLVTTGAPASVVILVVDDGIQGADKVSIDEPKTFPPAIPPAFAHIYTRKPLKIPTFGERLDELSENRLEPNRNNLPIPHGSAHLHGTHVTGILLGGAFAEPLKDLIAQNFKISIAHLNVLGPGGGDKLWVYNPVYMSYAITNAPEIKSGSAQPMIINLSAGASTRLNNLGKFLASNEALLVAAAGNDKADLTSMRRNTSFVYPAQDGGYGHLHIISVAASQGDRTLAPFSNYGIEHIDVAAPGCRILSLGSNGESALVTMSGTSQATPFVSLTAALLASGGLQLDDIKRRIWKTVDFTTLSITRSVASRGILNLPRALATSFDVVVRKDGSSLYGAAKPQVLRLCRVGSEEEFSIKQFDRVDFDVDADAQRCAVQAGSRCVRLNLRFIDDVDRRDLRHFRNPKFCRMSSDQLDSQRLEFVALDWNSTSNIVEARAVSIPYGEIASIVPAEGHTKGDDFYRNGIIDVTATRLK